MEDSRLMIKSLNSLFYTLNHQWINYDRAYLTHKRHPFVTILPLCIRDYRDCLHHDSEPYIIDTRLIAAPLGRKRRDI